MDDKAIAWMGSSKRDLLDMPEAVRRTFGYALGLAQNGLSYPDAKQLKQFSPAVVEVIEDHDSDTYRAIYTARFDDVVYVLHCFKKKSTSGIGLPKRDKATIEARLAEVRKIENSRRIARSKGLPT